MPHHRSGQLGIGEVRDPRSARFHWSGRGRRLNRLALVIATWFGCGYAPKGPGTAGSLAALVIAWLLNTYAGVSSIGLGWLALLLAIRGIWAADVVARSRGAKDPQIVVVDEVVGQWMTLAGATVLNWK